MYHRIYNITYIYFIAMAKVCNVLTYKRHLCVSSGTSPQRLQCPADVLSVPRTYIFWSVADSVRNSLFWQFYSSITLQIQIPNLFSWDRFNITTVHIKEGFIISNLILLTICYNSLRNYKYLLLMERSYYHHDIIHINFPMRSRIIYKSLKRIPT